MFLAALLWLGHWLRQACNISRQLQAQASLCTHSFIYASPEGSIAAVFPGGGHLPGTTVQRSRGAGRSLVVDDVGGEGLHSAGEQAATASPGRHMQTEAIPLPIILSSPAPGYFHTPNPPHLQRPMLPLLCVRPAHKEPRLVVVVHSMDGLPRWAAGTAVAAISCLAHASDHLARHAQRHIA